VGGVRAYWIGWVVAWVAVWLGTGVALGGSGQCGKVLPILVVGNLIGPPCQHELRHSTPINH
jgi:hypothetical protein